MIPRQNHLLLESGYVSLCKCSWRGWICGTFLRETQQSKLNIVTEEAGFGYLNSILCNWNKLFKENNSNMTNFRLFISEIELITHKAIIKGYYED